MHRALLLLLLLASVAALVAWRVATLAPSAASNGTMRVVATFYPLADFAERIGGGHVSVRTITPAGSEPHDYEPTPRDLLAAREASVVLMNGGLDAWMDRIVPDLKRGGVRVARMTDVIPSIEKDPHAWLDPVLAERMVAAIQDAFVSADPAHAEEYRANGERVVSDLRGLNDEYVKGLATCASRTVVVSHDAVGYLGARYGLRILPIAGLSPDEEPSPRRMTEIASLARAAGAHVIFFEELVSPKLAETIAREIGARTDVLDPIEGLTENKKATGANYFTLMRQNLDALRSALLCQ